MKKKHLFFAALFLAALVFGFSACENPDDDKSGISIEKPGDDSTSDKPTDSDGSDQDGDTKPTTPEAPTLVATGDATEVGRSSVKLWGRINTDTLWAFNNIKWGIECSISKETIRYTLTLGTKRSALPTLWVKTPMSTASISQV